MGLEISVRKGVNKQIGEMGGRGGEGRTGLEAVVASDDGLHLLLLGVTVEGGVSLRHISVSKLQWVENVPQSKK